MAIFDIFNKRKKKIEQHLKSYNELNNKLNEIDASLDTLMKGMSFIEAKEVIDNQKRYVINTMKEISISLDALITAYSEESKNKDYLSIYFNKLPKHSSFQGNKEYITEETDLNDFSEISVPIGKETAFLTKLIEEKSGLIFISKYIDFLNNKNIKIPKLLKKTYDIKKEYIEMLEYALKSYFIKTKIMLNRENVYEDIPCNFSAETILLHSYIRSLISNGIISKHKAYKLPVLNIPEKYKEFSDSLGIMHF